MRQILPAALRPRRITVVEAACGAGALDRGCKDGPAAFRRGGADRGLRGAGVEPRWRPTPAALLQVDAAPFDAVARIAGWLAGTTAELAAGGEAFAVVGGDHSCAIGTWSGVARGVKADGPLGLVWIDAHMDAHTPESTWSGALNGMPLAALLGIGPAALTGLAGGAPALRPEHVCLVGVRSFEPEEMALAERVGIRIIAMEEVRRRGLAAALDEAVRVACRGTAAFGLTLDLDAIDPLDAPAVGTPEPGGIRAAELRPVWRGLAQRPNCAGVEIAEYNPHRDRNGRTARLMRDLLAAAFAEEIGP